MQTLYIFGNGFDIAHGIRTPYAAFREFLKENHESFLTTFESMYNIQPLDDTEPWYTKEAQDEYYGAAEPPVRCGESHLSGLTEPPHFIY